MESVVAMGAKMWKEQSMKQSPKSTQIKSRFRWLRIGTPILVAILVLVGITTTTRATGLFSPEQLQQLLAPAPTAAVPAPTETSGAERLVSTNRYSLKEKPQSGWLYVVDTNQWAAESQVLLVDPTDGSVKAAYRTGYVPEIAVSPDGSRLYVISGVGKSNTLVTYDTATGNMLTSVEVPYRMMTSIQLLAPRMQLSLDGKALYILKMQTISPGQDKYSVAIYDTTTGSFLPNDIAVPGCFVGALFATANAMQVVCSETNDVRFVSRDQAQSGKSEAQASQRISIPIIQQAGSTQEDFGHIAGADEATTGGYLFVVTQQGRVFTIDSATRQISKQDRILLPTDAWVPVGKTAASRDGSVLFIGAGQADQRNQNVANQIISFSPATGQQLGIVQTRIPFWSLTARPDGREVYAVNRDQQSITVIDTVNNVEVQTLRVGVSPEAVVVAP